MVKKVELTRISDNEFQVCSNKIFLLDNNIIYIEVNGEQTDEIARTVKNSYEMVIKLMNSDSVKHLVNLNNSGKGTPEARRTWKQLTEHELTEKVALFGIHPVAKVLASFVMGVTNKKNIRFFNNKQDALLWLNE